MFKYLWKYFIASGVMVVILLLIENVNWNSYIFVSLKVVSGAGIYYLILYVLNDEVAKIIFTKFRKLIKSSRIFGGI